VLNLLAQADSRTGIEWKENEWIRSKVFFQSLVEETVRIELVGCALRLDISVKKKNEDIR